MRIVKLAAVLWIIGAVCGLAACGVEEGGSQTAVSAPEPAKERELTLQEVERLDEKTAEAEPVHFAYVYATLSEGEKRWYADILHSLETMEETTRLSEEGLELGLTESSVDPVFQSVLHDHPELFYVEGYHYTKYMHGDRIVAVDFSGTFSADAETVSEKNAQIEQALQQILRDAPTGMDDYSKIKYAYEVIIEQTDYDTEAPDNQNIYSVFVGHRSVCQGYAKAFQYLMERMGIMCVLVQGTVRDTGEGHAWDLVRSNGAFYYVDTTWGDISYQSAERAEAGEEPAFAQISYDYLCINTEQLLRTHEIDPALELPQYTATADNYYVREGAFFTAYDRDQLEALVERSLAAGEKDVYVTDAGENGRMLSLRCADRACYEEMCRALLDEREFFDYLAGTGIDSFVYATNDEQYTLTFFMVTSIP
ncbi:MAG: hypothetical protein IJ747_05770 [Lachnospiraceae bacterium]|nr:hypothetical protein [Lachnospiraceae bacterium]